MKRSAVTVPTVVVVVASAVAVTLWAAGLPVDDPRADLSVLVLFFAAIVLGSALYVEVEDVMPGVVDIGGTAALALTLTTGLYGHTIALGRIQVIAVAAVALLLGVTAARATVGESLAGGIRRVLPRIVTVVGLCLTLRDGSGRIGLLDEIRLRSWGGDSHVWAVMVLAVVLYVALLLEAPLRALAGDGPDPLTRRLAVQIRTSVLLGVVPVSTAVLIAVALPVLGHVSVPVILLPLVFHQLALLRHQELRRHSRQSVQALSAMPETMGLVREGHAARVADLSVRIGRSLGLSRQDLDVLERAAWLHDVGQVRSSEPVPGGVTILAAPVDQDRIAAAGADIVRATSVLDVEAGLIVDQAVPYAHHVSHRRVIPLGSRIIKVANAVDDLLTGSEAGLALPGPDAVVERLYLGLGHEYDPRVVDAYAGLTAAVSGSGLGGGAGPAT